MGTVGAAPPAAGTARSNRAAIRKGAKAIWMQEGVIHDDAARRAKETALEVVMNRCILKDHGCGAVLPEAVTPSPR